MKIWLDLAAAPQVLFFRPLLTELRCRGHVVTVTTREYAETVKLADKLGLDHIAIGQHGGRSRLAILRQILRRALTLAQWSRPQRFDLALSHNSYSQAVAATMWRLPVVTLMDYEHQPLNHLCFRLAKRVIVPECFPPEMLRKYGAVRKAVTYVGVKEQVYLTDFAPERGYRARMGLPTDCPLVVMRPPAPWTAYHRFENDLFDALLLHLAADNHSYLLFLPRLLSQAQSVRALPAVHVTSQVYDGPNLLYSADLVISGGGTMNREAAVLGTPTYTIFKGKLAAVDRYLIAKGRMEQLEAEGDFTKLHNTSSATRRPTLARRDLVRRITDQILETVS